MDLVVFYELNKGFAAYPKSPAGAYTVNGFVQECTEFNIEMDLENYDKAIYELGDMFWMAVFSCVEWLDTSPEDLATAINNLPKPSAEGEVLSNLADIWIKHFRKHNDALLAAGKREFALDQFAMCLKKAARQLTECIGGDIDTVINLALHANYGKLTERALQDKLTKEFGDGA